MGNQWGSSVSPHPRSPGQEPGGLILSKTLGAGGLWYLAYFHVAGWSETLANEGLKMGFDQRFRNSSRMSGSQRHGYEVSVGVAEAGTGGNK